MFTCLGAVAGSRCAAIGKFAGTFALTVLILFLFVFVVHKYFYRFRLPVFLFFFSVTALILVTNKLIENELSPFDNLIYDTLSKLISEDRTDLMKIISDMGSVYILGAEAVVLLLFFWLKPKYRFHGKMIVVNLIAVSLLNLLFKTIFHRARPDILQLVSAGGYSYPSGHSMISAAFYGYLVYLSLLYMKKPWKYFLSCGLLLLILSIGISRIYLGVHYASDVIAGFLTSLSWLTLFITLTKLYAQKSKLSAGRV
jgi:membrane-associated phospholipid phosphatase